MAGETNTDDKPVEGVEEMDLGPDQRNGFGARPIKAPQGSYHSWIYGRWKGAGQENI